MKIPTLTGLRDLALLAGSAALTVMAVRELTLTDPRTVRPHTGAGLPATRHGWLYAIGGTSEDRPRRLRPATADEATASAASAVAGYGGFLGMTEAGEIVTPDDPRYLSAGRWSAEAGQIDVVYVALAPIAAGELLAEADALLAGDGEDDDEPADSEALASS